MPLAKRVFIVDDDESIRKAYTTIVNSTPKFKVVGDFDNCEDAIKAIRKLKPDIIMMDIGLPQMSGIEGTRAIFKIDSRINIIVVSVHDDGQSVFEALKAGASGYITKGANYTELLSALEEIERGGAPMSSKIARLVVQDFHLSHTNPLTKRESYILSMVAEGKTYTQIAREANISKDTAKTHIRNIYKRLQVNKKSDAINKGRKEKLIGLF
ncbi:MAG: response regulator transcription factor [Bacteroidota bacterium]